MQKRLGNKKGISPLIATVLLIAATIGLFLIVFALIRGITVGTIEKSTDCGAQESTSLDITGSFTCDESNPDQTDITVVNNGQVKVEGFMFVLYNGDTGVGIPPTLNPTKAGEQSITQIRAKCPDRIEIYPGIIKESSGKAKFIVCKDKKIDVTKS